MNIINSIISHEEYAKFVTAHSDQVLIIMAEAEKLGRKRCDAFLATGGDGMMQHMIAFANYLTELPAAKKLMPQMANAPKLKAPEPIDMLTTFVAIALNELLLPIILESSKPAAKALN